MAAAVLLVVIAYAPALGAGFVWDDVDHIEANPRIESGAAALEYFTRPEGRYHRPLVFLSYAAEYQLWGRRAAGSHATNLVLHLINAFLLAAAVRRLAEPTVAFAAALLFALHPVQTEAVAYVSGRTDLLMTCGALSAWTILLGAGPAWRKGIAAAVAAACAALSKESGYALLLLVPWIAVRREKDWAERAGAALPTVLALSALLAMRPAALPGVVEWGWSTLAGVGKGLVGYASLVVWPATLMVDRLTFLPTTAAGTAFCVAALFAAGLLAGWGLRSGAAAADWTAWSVAFYLPVANFVPLYPGIAERALFTPEHNLYASSAGLAVLAALGLDRVARLSSRRRAVFLRYGALGLFLVLTARTALRAAEWHDESSLFGAAVAAGSRSPRVHYNLGNVLLGRGDLGAAERAYESALTLAPRDGQTWANLGIVRQRQGDLGAALDAEQRAAALLPDDPQVRENVGALHLSRGDLVQARAAFAEALRLDPTRRRARKALQALEAMARQR